MKHTLVTGGHGFIGGYVVEELLARGHHVSVLDRHIAVGQHDHDVFFGDIKDAALVTDAVSHVDGVIHLAGVLGTQETIGNPLPAAQTNILGGLNVISACAQYDVPLVNIAVGNWWMDNTYSITKNAVERFVKMKAKYEGHVMGSVRALNAYGARQVPAEPYGPSRVRKIMPSFICKALSGEPIEIYGDGNQVMDMIYVTDVAFILAGALEALHAGVRFETLEAGTGVQTTVNDIAEEVATAVLGLTGKTVTVGHTQMRPGEDEHSIVVGDPETLSPLGIRADQLIQLPTGVHQTVAYFDDYLASR
jgi:UDP-glucose 4-epimerase